MLSDSKDFTDPDKTRVWAEHQCRGYLAAEGPWHESI